MFSVAYFTWQNQYKVYKNRDLFDRMAWVPWGVLSQLYFGILFNFSALMIIYKKNYEVLVYIQNTYWMAAWPVAVHF